MMRRAFVALALVAAWPLRAAPATLADVRARLTLAPVVRGHFEQRKEVRGFRKPLVSTGEFVLAQRRGLLWQTREPFVATLVITRDGILQRDAEGRAGKRIDTRKEPGLRVVNELLLALLAADFDRLAQSFRGDAELRDGGAWRMRLVPADEQLQRWVERVELDGDEHLRALRLVESSGDTTAIRFSRHSTAADLDAAEAASFD
jgi:hypothetical protein